MLALVDCNNFFVSCERVFDPGLQHRPVAVLSSNDGCIIARSNEVKDLDVPMGAPLFEYQQLLKRHQVVLKSSNFQLYRDMSNRVMTTLQAFSSAVRAYSIDEAFLEVPANLNTVVWANELRQTLLKNIGIPVSVGVAPTCTLTKAAVYLAKQEGGVMSFEGKPEAYIDSQLAQIPVSKVWGVGRKITKSLGSYGICSALALKKIPQALLSGYPITLERIVLELRGTTAVVNTDSHSKSMVSSRSFGKDVYEERELKQALSSHAAQIGLKLRNEGLVAAEVGAFIGTGERGQYLYEKSILPVATNDTFTLTKIVVEISSRIFRPGLRYKKAGVSVRNLTFSQQLTLGAGSEEQLRRLDSVNATVDSINYKWGSSTLVLAAEGVKQTWRPKHNLRSPQYTTNWSELKKVS